MTPHFPSIRYLQSRPVSTRESFSAEAFVAPFLARLPEGPVSGELRSLSRERDPDLFFEGLLGLAQRQEAAGAFNTAGELYLAILSATGLSGVYPIPSLRNRAQASLDAIQGRGALGPRAEYLLRHLTQQACDPAALLAMGAAGSVFRMTRMATLSHLAATGEAGIMTRFLGAGRLASLAGFALEAPSFTLAARLGSEALGRRQDWSGGALGRDVASSFLVLGGLKLAGWASASVHRGFAPAVGAVHERPLQILFQQGGMFSGILLGHALETHLGLRPRQDGATTLLDSFALLLQFNIAGRLTRHAFGPRFAAWEAGLDRQAEAMQANWRLPRHSWGGAEETLLQGPVLAMASGPDEAGLRLPNRLFSKGIGRPIFVAASGGPSLPEVRPSLDGRARPVDRDLAPGIKVIEAQGVFWVIDIDTEFRNRSLEVRVGEHLLPRGGSLRVREGEIIRLGEREFRFREPERNFSPEISSAEASDGVRVSRYLHQRFQQGGDARYELRFQGFVDQWNNGQNVVFASGPQGDARLRLIERRSTVEGDIFHIEVADAELSFPITLELTPNRVILRSYPQPQQHSSLLPMFLDWLSTQTYVRASDLQFEAITPEIHELLGYGLIHSSYSRYEHHGDRIDLVTQPRATLLPMELGFVHRAAAESAFNAWALRRFGVRIPDMVEIDNGASLPEFNFLGIEPTMPAILDRLVSANTRFLEIGFGERLDTLQAVERRGGHAWGLELSKVYPPEADREVLRRSDLDVLFINGSPFLFYTGHHVALPAALDILRQFPRAEWLVIQAYNPRTPFEILRHAEELHRLRWDPMYYRVASSLSEAPIFPTDWSDRPDTPHAVLIARRPRPGNNGLTPRY